MNISDCGRGLDMIIHSCDMVLYVIINDYDGA